MADATVNSFDTKTNCVQRITIGTAAQRPLYAKNTPLAIHFQCDTTWPISYWDGLTWQNAGLGADPTGNATVQTYNVGKHIHLNRITIGTAAQRPGYSPGSDQALHFLTNTTWTLSYWDGSTWQNVMLLGDPTGDAVLSAWQSGAAGSPGGKISRITVGVAANRPVYWVGAPLALHFQTDTAYPVSFFNGSAWVNLSLMSAP